MDSTRSKKRPATSGPKPRRHPPAPAGTTAFIPAGGVSGACDRADWGCWLGATRRAAERRDALRAGTTPRVRWPVQVTTQGARSAPGDLSAGDAIAFASDRSGRFEIYIRGLAAPRIDIAAHQRCGHNVQPAWSPDGRADRVSFIAPRRHLGDLRRAAARQTDRARGSKPAWSPDGPRIAFQSDEHARSAPTGSERKIGSTIWIVDADGGNAQRARPAARWAATRRRRGAATAVSSRSACSRADRRTASGSVDIEAGTTTQLHRGHGLSSRCSRRAIRRFMSPAAKPSSSGCRSIPASGRLRAASRGHPDRRCGRRARCDDVGRWPQAGLRGGFGRQSNLAAAVRARWTPPAAAPLTSDTSQRNSLPVVSPDGSKLAYVSIAARRGAERLGMGIDGRIPPVAVG